MLDNLRRQIGAKIDPVGWLGAAGSVALDAAKNPAGVASATGNLAIRLVQIPPAAARVAFGSDAQAPLSVERGDNRFRDKTWQDNPGYFSILQAYLAARAYVDELVDAGAKDEFTTAKARQFADLVMDLVSPTNSPVTNPTVLARAIETGGKSLVRGAGYALEDLLQRGGRPLRVDHDAFTLGENMAASPGQVVFRNDLIELIQYAPQTPQVHEIPLLACPPWINKYYIMDLGPGRSYIEWAIKHNRTVFVISYKNPDSSMRGVTFDDYLEQGIDAAMDAVLEITGAPRVDIAGVCLGGAMASIAAGHFAGKGDQRMGTLTLINTILDYSAPGDLGLMTDPETRYKLDILMDKTGLLSGDDMSLTFDLLRANDLIFGYWVSRWMLGEPPAAFDLLVWNEDSTGMPAAMHSRYLQSLYGDNELVTGEFTVGDQAISLAEFTNDVYIIGAVNDHIVPWESSYAGARLFGGDVRFALSNGGHIAGIVNPPGKKSWVQVLGAPDAKKAPVLPADAQEWQAKATKSDRSWWQDWATWSSQRAGALQDPPAMGSKAHPVLGEAPGAYVFS